MIAFLRLSIMKELINKESIWFYIEACYIQVLICDFEVRVKAWYHNPGKRTKQLQ